MILEAIFEIPYFQSPQKPKLHICYPHGPTYLQGKVWGHAASICPRWRDLHFIGLQYTIWKVRGPIARVYRGCMTQNFALQVSRSIWVTYVQLGLLGWLEVWYFKNGLQITSFISVAYYINFERRSLARARTRGAQILQKALGGPPTTMFHSLGF